MAAINLTDLQNAKEDVDHIAEVATSSSPTSTDRLGQSKLTLVGAVATIAAINRRGSWAPFTAYASKDLVLESDVWYIAVQPHTSAATFSSDAAYWRIYQGVTSEEIALPNFNKYGAVGDGATDNTTALALAKASVGVGGRVAVSPGTYYFAGSPDFADIVFVPEDGVSFSVASTNSIKTRAWRFARDITLINRAKTTYRLAANVGNDSLLRLGNGVMKEDAMEVESLAFNSGWTAWKIDTADATYTVSAGSATLSSTAATWSGGTWGLAEHEGVRMRARLGEMVEVSAYAPTDRDTGRALCRVWGTNEYLDFVVLDATNEAGATDYAAMVYRKQGGGAWDKAKEAPLPGREFAVGGERRTVLGVKVVAHDEVEFYVNGLRIFREKLTYDTFRTPHIEYIGFGWNSGYSGDAVKFSYPVRYKNRYPGSGQTVKIAYFGDSITFGSHINLTWPEMLKILLEGQEGIGYVDFEDADNFGVSGDKAADQLVDMQAADLTPYDVVVVMVGVNDIVAQTSVTSFRTSLESMATEITAAGAIPIFAVPTMYSSTWGSAGGEYRNTVARVCASGGYIMADTASEMGGDFTNVTTDSIHPNVNGNLALSRAIGKAVMQAFRHRRVSRVNPDYLHGDTYVMQDAALPETGYYQAGDRWVITAPAEGAPAEYVCVTAGVPGTWRVTRQAGVKKGATGARPSLSSSDAGVMYLDTTLDADGKPVWWTGIAWVDATGAGV